MKNIISILCFTYLLSGCLYTKKRAIEKFCSTDSIPYSVLVHDTIYIKAIKVDTFFNSSIDSFTIIKDRLEIRYKKVGEKIFIQGECKSDTIYKTKLVQVQVPTGQEIRMVGEFIYKIEGLVRCHWVFSYVFRIISINAT